MIERPPSAELRPNQKDSDSLPPYEVLDPILEAFIEEDLSVDEIAARGFDRATVVRVLDLVKRNEYKRRQAPPGVRVSRRAFGRDWRYPITNGYRSRSRAVSGSVSAAGAGAACAACCAGGAGAACAACCVGFSRPRWPRRRGFASRAPARFSRSYA